MAKADLTAERLRESLEYNQETGIFTRRVNIANMKAGQLAGNLMSNGYWCVGVCGFQYYAHRLAWLYVTGEWPIKFIDHIDGNPLNNAFVNLRQASVSQNLQNRKRATRANKSGFLGVIPVRDKWMAKLCIDGKQAYFGTYKTPEEAHAACVEAKRIHYSHFVDSVGRHVDSS